MIFLRFLQIFPCFAYLDWLRNSVGRLRLKAHRISVPILRNHASPTHLIYRILVRQPPRPILLNRHNLLLQVTTSPSLHASHFPNPIHSTSPLPNFLFPLNVSLASSLTPSSSKTTAKARVRVWLFLHRTWLRRIWKFPATARRRCPPSATATAAASAAVAAASVAVTAATPRPLSSRNLSQGSLKLQP